MDGRSVRNTPSTQLSREQIMQATMACLTQDGYDATTIRRIAARLDCAVGSIYRYYTDKHELLSVVTQQALAPVVIALEAGESFHHSLGHYHRIVSQHPETYRLMFWLACHDPQSPVAAGHLDTSRVPLVVDRIIKGWAKQLDSPTDARYVWAVLHGTVLLGATLQDVFDAITPRLPAEISSKFGEPEPVYAEPATPVASEPAPQPAVEALPAVEIIVNPAAVIPPPRSAPTPSPLTTIAVATAPDDVTLL
jgi:AcrR family transcriptional regulator